jgi:hypothetical protein
MVGEVMITCEKIRYTCKYGEGYLSADYRKVPLMLGFKSASVQYYPLGVIGCIVPWVSLLIQYYEYWHATNLVCRTILSTTAPPPSFLPFLLAMLQLLSSPSLHHGLALTSKSSFNPC